jgi:hypothetical protein
MYPTVRLDFGRHIRRDIADADRLLRERSRAETGRAEMVGPERGDEPATSRDTRVERAGLA